MKKARKIKRQQIKETVARVSPWELSGSSESIYKNLQDTESYYSGKDIIEIYWEWESGHYDDSGELALIVTRLENDKEYSDRLKKLEKIAEKAKKEEEKERELYLKLHQKFGK